MKEDEELVLVELLLLLYYLLLISLNHRHGRYRGDYGPG